jgi:leucyl/phenylalanyl-tRNA--protein transferase
MFFQLLEDELIFPNPELAEEDGLLAIGGDLSMKRLLLAYSNGIFPWFSEDDPILWYSPHERCVIYPDRIKVSKSMAKLIKDQTFKVTTDTVFEKVIELCASVPRVGQGGTWITKEMQNAYINLYKNGYAHSVEVWLGTKLVGGLYGIKINRVFCGESMFSLVSNASKMALIYLSETDIDLIDCQLPNDHLMSMGAEMMERKIYNNFLQAKNIKA